MQKIKNSTLAQLFMETGFAPNRQQRKQLIGAEELYKIIEPERQYPYEFVCFKITGYRPKINTQQVIEGKDLKKDLPVYILRESGRLNLKANQQDEKIYSLDALAKKFNVTNRTIERWRQRGLTARRYIFDKKKTGIGFAESVVDEFVKKNEELIKKASKFELIDSVTKHAIIETAQKIGADENLSRTAVIKKTAEAFKRAPETIRLIINNYERRIKRPIFKNLHNQLDAKEIASIYQMSAAGVSIKQIAEKFNKSVSSIYRIINRRAIRMLLAAKIEYIMSDEFTQAGAEEKILAAPVSVRRMPKGLILKEQTKQSEKSEDVVEAIKKIPALTREQEAELFRRYNFCKFLAAGLVKKLSLTESCAAAAQKAGQLLSSAERIKNLIIEANLSLVFRVAGKHAIGANMADLVSEGNMALIRAVEKFDYAKGFRFSTYASWVIAREFARLQPGAKQAAAEKSDLDDASIWQHLKTRPAGVEEIEMARSSLEEVIKENLTTREQYVIRYHFGLTGSLVKKQFKTLKQMGDELGISKERVRQIELIALGKLRQTLSPEEFNLLTK